MDGEVPRTFAVLRVWQDWRIQVNNICVIFWKFSVLNENLSDCSAYWGLETAGRKVNRPLRRAMADTSRVAVEAPNTAMFIPQPVD